MHEKDPNREEKLQLGKALANSGEDAIFEVMSARNMLLLCIIDGLQHKKISMETVQFLKSEAQNMTDVIEIARNIQKLHGTDIESEIEKIRLKSAFGKFEE